MGLFGPKINTFELLPIFLLEFLKFYLMIAIRNRFKVTGVVFTGSSYHAQNGVNGVFVDQNSTFF